MKILGVLDQGVAVLQGGHYSCYCQTDRRDLLLVAVVFLEVQIVPVAHLAVLPWLPPLAGTGS